MPAFINTNIASLNSQRNLSGSQSALQVSLQRLSSGLRINSAKDDAAGLAISERFTTQIRGLNQAVRNSNDGISLAQTGEGALGEVTSNLQRIRELAVQATNSTNSASDRAALDLEVQQRLAEIDRTAAQTSFNGQKILDGTFGNATFQVGANVGETISVGLSTSMRTATIGKTADIVGGAVYDSTKNVGQQGTGVVAGTPLAGTAGTLSIAVGTGQAVGVGASSAGSAVGQTNGSAYAKAAAINAANISGLTATADTTLQTAFTKVTDSDYKLTINGVAIANGDYSAAANNITGSGMAALINQNQSATGVSATYDSTTGNLTLNAADGRNIAIQQSNAAASAVTTTGFGAVTNAGGRTNNTVNAALTSFLASFASQTAVGSIKLSAADSITVSGTQVGDIGFASTSYAVGNTALSSASVTSVANANLAIARVDAALTTVSTLRSTFGAIQNRFESVISSLSATAENLTASRSRIQDADFAQETANLTRAQILQQAGTAMLAQANQVPNTVLTLLR